LILYLYLNFFKGTSKCSELVHICNSSLNNLINEINETTSSSFCNENSNLSNIPNNNINSNQRFVGKFKQAANDVISKQITVSSFNQSSFNNLSSNPITLENKTEHSPEILKENPSQILEQNDKIDVVSVEACSLEKNKKKKEPNCFFTIFNFLFRKKIKQ
jgi:hypothetical protein